MIRKYVYVLAAGHFLCDIAMGALPAILPFFISFYGMDYKAIGGLMFASCFLSSIIQPIFGWLADKKPKSWFMPFGILVAGAAMGLTGMTNEYWLIFTLIMISGVGSAIFHPEATCMLNKVSGTKRGTALSIFSVGGNSGFAVGPILAVSAITTFGMPGTSVFIFLALGMSALLMLIVPRIKAEIVATSAVSSPEKHQVKENVQNDWAGFSRLVLLIACVSIVICGLRSFIPLYWVDVMALSHAAAGTALTLLFTLGVITTMIGGLLADRFGYLKIVRMSYVLLALSVAALSQTMNATIAYALLIPIGFAMFAPFSSIVVLGQTYLARSIGFASGVTMGLFFSIGGIIVPLLGYFADAHGLALTMELLAAVSLLATIAAFILPSSSKRAVCCTRETTAPIK